jgi:hypothetical protein
MSEHTSPDPPQEENFRTVREYIEAAGEYHARTGEWPPDPLLDEVAEMRRKVMAEHGNDWRNVLQWYLEQDRQYAEQNPGARVVEKPDPAAGVSRP